MLHSKLSSSSMISLFSFEQLSTHVISEPLRPVKVVDVGVVPVPSLKVKRRLPRVPCLRVLSQVLVLRVPLFHVLRVRVLCEPAVEATPAVAVHLAGLGRAVARLTAHDPQHGFVSVASYPEELAAQAT